MKEEIARNGDATDEEKARGVGPSMIAGHANCRQILRVREGEERRLRDEEKIKRKQNEKKRKRKG